MKNIILLHIAIIITLFSCKKNGDFYVQKNKVFTNLPSLGKIFGFINDQHTSGKFMINVTSPLGKTDKKYFDVDISGGFLNKETQQREAGQFVSINGLIIPHNRDNISFSKTFDWNTGKAVLGTKISMQMVKTGFGSFTNSDTIKNLYGGYSPEVFVCTNNFSDNVMTDSSRYYSGTKLKPSFTFTWIPDSLNRNGVFVYLEYDPTNPANDLFKDTYPSKVANGIIVDDNGSYTLPADMFTNMPLNSRLSIYMGRGISRWILNGNGTPTDMQISSLTYQYDNLFYKTD